jgi:hypothetical protein
VITRRRDREREENQNLEIYPVIQGLLVIHNSLQLFNRTRENHDILLNAKKGTCKKSNTLL